MEKKKLLVDIDDVMCHDGFLALINEFLNTDYKYEEMKEYYLQKLVPEEKLDDWWDFFFSKNNYNYAEILPDTYEVIKKLDDKYDIYICSACIIPNQFERTCDAYKKKYQWLRKNFEFLDPYKFIFMSTKNIIKVDIQIDDKLENLQGDVETSILFTAYHNRDIEEQTLEKEGVIRANNWKEIEKILL